MSLSALLLLLCLFVVWASIFYVYERVRVLLSESFLAGAWTRLSALAEAADEPKTVLEKLLVPHVKRWTTAETRKRAEGAPLVPCVQYLLDRTVTVCHGVLIVMQAIVAYWFLAALLLPVSVPDTSNSSIVAGNAWHEPVKLHTNGTTYKWATVGGVARVVPECRRYHEAEALYREEVRVLLAAELLKDEKAHARCLMALRDDVSTMFRQPPDTLVDLQAVSEYVDASTRRWLAVDRNATVRAHDFVYVARNGDRYLRLAMRSNDAAMLDWIMVAERDLTAFLQRWQKQTSEVLLGVTMHYCMCPVYLGILDDDIVFYFNRDTDAWEIWLAPEIVSTNPVGGLVRRRIRYAEKIAPLPARQHARLQLNDTNDHYHEHYNTIKVAYLNPARVTKADVVARERFWMGHADIKIDNDPTQPFALAVPLVPETHRTERTLTADDVTCYYHCRDMSARVMALVK